MAPADEATRAGTAQIPARKGPWLVCLMGTSRPGTAKRCCSTSALTVTALPWGRGELLPNLRRAGHVHEPGEPRGFDASNELRPVAIYLNRPGIDYNRFSHKFQGLHARLTGVEGAKGIKSILT